MKKIFVILAALAALTMAGCAASGGESLSPPSQDVVADWKNSLRCWLK